MNLADLFVVLFVVGAMPAGALIGGMLQAGFFGGFAGGVAAGMGVSMLFSGLPGGGLRGLLTLLVIFLAGSGLAVGGFVAGRRARTAMREADLERVDAGFGAVVAGVLAVFAAWLLSAPLAVGSEGFLAREVQESSALGAVERALPPPATLFGGLWSAMGVDPVAPVYAQLEPADTERVALPSEAEVAEAFEAARDSIVRVVAGGCPGEQEGTGFVVGPELVVASSHVVAGTPQPHVEDAGGLHQATPVVFDPGVDIVVLRVPGLERAPLRLVRGPVERGVTGAVVGYPIGTLHAEPAAVLQRATVLARDQSGALEERDVYQLRARVREGMSGGPMIRADGAAVGVVFSRSLVDEELGYAVTSSAISDHVERARRARDAVSTGDCHTPRERGQSK